MTISKTLMAVLCVSSALLLSPFAQAAKENFDRSKPHLNIGVAINGEDFGDVVAMSGLGIKAPVDDGTATHYSDVTLKRGYTGSNGLKKWAEDAARTAGKCDSCRRDISVKILSHSGEVLKTFNLFDVIPVEWQLSSVDTGKGDLLTETLTVRVLRIQDI